MELLAQAYFGREKSILVAGLFWEKKVYFGRRPILGERSLFLGRGLFWGRESYFSCDFHMWQKRNMQKKKEKQHAKKEGKATCEKKRDLVHHLNHTSPEPEACVNFGKKSVFVLERGYNPSLF
jgi:hypothetical protein